MNAICKSVTGWSERIRRFLQWAIPAAAWVGLGAHAYQLNHSLYAWMLLATIMLALAVAALAVWISLCWVYGWQRWPHRWPCWCWMASKFKPKERERDGYSRTNT